MSPWVTQDFVSGYLYAYVAGKLSTTVHSTTASDPAKHEVIPQHFYYSQNH